MSNLSITESSATTAPILGSSSRIGCRNHAENVRKVRRYLARLRKRKQGLPSRSMGGAIALKQIAREEDIPCNALRGNRVKDLLAKHEAEFGTELHALPAPKKPTLAGAEKYAVGKRRKMNIARGMSHAKDVPTVRKVFRAAGIGRLAGRADAETAIARLSERLEANPLSLPAGVRRELPFVRDCVRELVENGGLPAELGPRIRVCLAEAGLALVDAACAIQVPRKLLDAWAGGVMPSRKNLRYLEALEKLCRRDGVLTKLVVSTRTSFGAIPLRCYPVDIQGEAHAGLREAMANDLPTADEFAQLECAVQDRLMNEARERWDPFAKLAAVQSAMVQDHYAIHEWTLAAELQWQELVQHHQGGVRHFERPARTRWGGRTVLMRRMVLSCVFGAAASEEAGALRLNPEEVDFARVMANPRYVQIYVDRKSAKRKAGGGSDDVTHHDAQIFGLFASEFQRNGWARQSMLVRESMGFGGRSDAEWAFHCDELSADYRDRSADTRHKAKHTVPIHKNTQHILKMARPMTVVGSLVHGLAGTWHSMMPGMGRAEALQDLIYAQMQAQVGFRPGTTARLTWRADNTGHLKRDADGWFLEAPREIFKNSHTPRLAHGFKKRLIDQWGFYEQLEAFLADGRETLLAGITEGSSYLFFFGKSGIGAAQPGTRDDENVLERCCCAIYSRTVAATKRFFRVAKIPGVLFLSPTDFRDVLATAVLKQHAMTASANARSNGIRLAADAIYDDEETIELHYVQYLPEERSAELLDLQRMAGHEANSVPIRGRMRAVHATDSPTATKKAAA
jgi:hypothetical protein